MNTGKPTIEVPNQQPEDYFAGPEDPGGFFDNLGESAAATTITGSSPTHATANGGAASEPGTPLAGLDSANHAAVSESTEREEEIQRALFVGNYAAAVDACLRAGRMADALLIANIGGADLFKRTMHRYMRRNPRPYMQVGGGRAMACSYARFQCGLLIMQVVCCHGCTAVCCHTARIIAPLCAMSSRAWLCFHPLLSGVRCWLCLSYTLSNTPSFTTCCLYPRL